MRATARDNSRYPTSETDIDISCSTISSHTTATISGLRASMFSSRNSAWIKPKAAALAKTTRPGPKYAMTLGKNANWDTALTQPYVDIHTPMPAGDRLSLPRSITVDQMSGKSSEAAASRKERVPWFVIEITTGFLSNERSGRGCSSRWELVQSEVVGLRPSVSLMNQPR